ncbi:MAG: 30S ribosomal protein S8e [Promethearchaeota archaeon]
MAKWQKDSVRKFTGGKRHTARGKRKRELGRYPVETRIGERSVKRKRIRGGKIKLRVAHDDKINVSDGGKTQSLKILEVIFNPSNKDMDRRKIITKGTIVRTKIGNVRVTSSPGQVPLINGIPVKE